MSAENKVQITSVLLVLLLLLLLLQIGLGSGGSWSLRQTRLVRLSLSPNVAWMHGNGRIVLPGATAQKEIRETHRRARPRICALHTALAG